MASLRGEISVEQEGRSWRLVLDFNAFAWVEELLSAGAGDGEGEHVTYADLCRAFGEGRLSARQARAVVWGAALRHQPETTLQEAGDLLSGDIALVARLFAAASPAPAEQDALGNSSAPQVTPPAGPSPTS